MIESIISIILGFSMTVVVWEVIIMFGKILYDDFREDKIEYCDDLGDDYFDGKRK